MSTNKSARAPARAPARVVIDNTWPAPRITSEDVVRLGPAARALMDDGTAPPEDLRTRFSFTRHTRRGGPYDGTDYILTKAITPPSPP